MHKVGAIILAAGQSKRMGKPKLLLPFLNTPLIHYPVSLAVGKKFHPILVVGGKYIHELQAELDEYSEQISIIYNSNYGKGMSTSLWAGILAIEEQVDAVFIFLGDQPFVSGVVVETMMEIYKRNREKGVKIVRPRYKSQPGHPILFDKTLFREFRNLSGDEGGKSIIEANHESLIYVDFENTMLNIDIDTPQDYESLIKNSQS